MKVDFRLRRMKSVLIASGVSVAIAFIILLIVGGVTQKLGRHLNPFSGDPADWLFMLIMFLCADFGIALLCVHLRTRRTISRSRVENIKKLQVEKDKKIDDCMRDLEQQLQTIDELNSAVEGVTADNARLEREVEGEKHVHQRTVEELKETGLRHIDLQTRAKGHYEKLYEELLDTNKEITEENEEFRDKNRLLHEQLMMGGQSLVIPATTTPINREWSHGRRTEQLYDDAAPLRPAVSFDDSRGQISGLQRQTAEKDKEIDILVQARTKLEDELASLKKAATKPTTIEAELAIELAQARKKISRLMAAQKGKAKSDGSSSSSSSSSSSGSSDSGSQGAENPLESTAASSIPVIPISVSDAKIEQIDPKIIESLKLELAETKQREEESRIDPKIIESLKLELAETKQREEESREIAAELKHETAKLQAKISDIHAQKEQLFRRMGAQEDEEKTLLLNASKEKVVRVCLREEKENLLQSKVREALSLVRRARSKTQEDSRSKEAIIGRQGLMGQLFKKQGWHVFDEENPETFFKHLRDDNKNNASPTSISAPALASESAFLPASRVIASPKERALPTTAQKAKTDSSSATLLPHLSSPSSASSSASFPAPSTLVPRGTNELHNSQEEVEPVMHLSAAEKVADRQATSEGVSAKQASEPSTSREYFAPPSGSGSGSGSGSESGSGSGSSGSGSGSGSGSSGSGSGSGSGSYSGSLDRSGGSGNSGLSNDYDLR